MKLFLKSTISSKSIFSDFWVIVLSSFVFTFVLLFSTSMLSSLEDLERYFVSARVRIDESGYESDDIKADIDSLHSLSGVESVDAVVANVGVIETDNFFQRVVLKRVGADYFDKRARVINAKIDYNYKSPTIISRSIAAKYGLRVGDKVGFLTNEKSKRARLLTIAGFYDTGLGDFDETFAFEVVQDYQSLLNEKGVVLEIVDYSKAKFSVYPNNIFSRLAKKAISDYDKYSSVVEFHKIRSGERDENLLQSFNSVKFILYLFSLIIWLYFFVAINNFNIRNSYNFRIFDILGDSNLRFKKIISCIIITFLSMLIGITLAICLVCLSPRILSYLTSRGIVDFTYYFTNFNIDILNADLTFFILSNLLISAVIYLIKVRK